MGIKFAFYFKIQIRMNSLEEFNNYYIQQSKEYSDESEYEDFNKEEEKTNVNKEDIEIKIMDSATSKRLRVLPKRYRIYNIEFKKKILEEVNKYIYIYNYFIG